MNLPSITGMSIIVPCQTNIRQPLKGFNRLAISHSVPRSRDNTYSVWFQKYCPEHLNENLRYSDSLSIGVNFEQSQKRIPKCAACLLKYIDIVHTVGQKLLLIAEIFVFSFLVLLE
jgi:hypothetical protein